MVSIITAHLHFSDYDVIRPNCLRVTSADEDACDLWGLSAQHSRAVASDATQVEGPWTPRVTRRTSMSTALRASGGLLPAGQRLVQCPATHASDQTRRRPVTGQPIRLAARNTRPGARDDPLGPVNSSGLRPDCSRRHGPNRQDSGSHYLRQRSIGGFPVRL
jgi:hypothetical protein